MFVITSSEIEFDSPISKFGCWFFLAVGAEALVIETSHFPPADSQIHMQNLSLLRAE